MVMTREPRLGRVKSRLAEDIGRIGALRVHRRLTTHVFRRLSGPEDWDRIALVTPDSAVGGQPFWPRGWRAVGQGRGDLGARMARPMRDLPRGPAVLVGADIPDIEKRHVREAFRLLGRCDAVFGPAADGGFWLVGFARRRPVPRNLFSGIAWSRRTTLADTLASLSESSIAFVDQLGDLDRAADLPLDGTLADSYNRSREKRRDAAQ